ncbi:MAG: spore cortex-lytic enzyme [Clostridia bacterium]|nr:spore cortex-lytic enzyme [Clostridia bacterium]
MNKKRFLISLVLALSLMTAFILNESNAFALSKYGSSGSEVTQIQQKLQSLGYYSGRIDGIYGTNTKKAVTEFQKSCGLTPDGIAGTKTLSYLGLSSSSNNYGFTQSETDLLARTISAEARGEPYEGQVAVGAVILNRIEHPSFPNTMAGVIYQNGAFSCIDDGQINQPVSESSKRAAVDAMNGWDPSGGAIYYYNPVTATSKWIRSRPIMVTIGAHVFCS